eukprot:gene6837-28157_t
MEFNTSLKIQIDVSTYRITGTSTRTPESDFESIDATQPCAAGGAAAAAAAPVFRAAEISVDRRQ